MIRAMLENYLPTAALLLVIGGFAAAVFVKMRPVPEESRAVGSASCQRCHDGEHAGWSTSLHPKMMRRVAQPGVVVADLSISAERMPFEPGRAVWAIGSKWEQQFMGHDGQAETLLPGSWLVGPRKWKTTGWDGWQVPVPLQRCHGCHTVGLDVETGTFVEPGIGCESCHGPGEWHANARGFGRIHSSVDADVCGQCHNRGRSTDGRYFFPVGYRPGYDLAQYFTPLRPNSGQNTAQWWGNGRERSRHQEYDAWARGGHADSLRKLKEGYDGRFGRISSECLGCHAGEAAARGGSTNLTLEDVEHGVTCAVCHNVHGELDELRLQCSDCHGKGAFYHRPELNADHVACPESAGVDCIGCHMPLTVENGGGYTLHSHAPGISPPADTRAYGVPSSCANGGCHADKEIDWLQNAFDRHYVQGNRVVSRR